MSISDWSSDVCSSDLSLVGISLPTFLIGILLILVFGVLSQDINAALGLALVPQLPTFGRGDTVQLGWWSTGFLTESGLLALILPSIPLALVLLPLTTAERLCGNEWCRTL